MRPPALFLAVALALPAASWVACDEAEPLPNLQEAGILSIDSMVIESDGVLAPSARVDAGDDASVVNVSPSAGVLQLVVTVSAPAGPWQLLVTADGALAVTPSPDGGGAAVRSFVSDGTKAQIVVPLTTVIASGGSSTLRVVLGDLTQTLHVIVGPDDYSYERVCIVSFDAGVFCPRDAGPPTKRMDAGSDAKHSEAASDSTTDVKNDASDASSADETSSLDAGADATHLDAKVVPDGADAKVVDARSGDADAQHPDATVAHGGAADATVGLGQPFVPAGVSAVLDGGYLLTVAPSLLLYHKGDLVYVLVDDTIVGAAPVERKGAGATMGAQANATIPIGELVTGRVTTSGSLSLLLDGGPGQSTPVTLTRGEMAPLMPAIFTAAGVATVAVQIGEGAEVRRVYQSGTALVAPTMVTLIGTPTPALARELVTVCTTASTGPMTASVGPDGGMVTTPTVNIESPAPEACPVGYPGQASFGWQGNQNEPLWTFTLADGGVTSVSAIPMFGIPTATTVTGSCIMPTTPDADVLAWVVIPPPPPVPGDGGALRPPDASALGTLVVDVETTLELCAGTALANKTVSVAGTGGLSPTSPTAVTDQMGNVVVELRGPAAPETQTVVVFTYGGG